MRAIPETIATGLSLLPLNLTDSRMKRSIIAEVNFEPRKKINNTSTVDLAATLKFMIDTSVVSLEAGDLRRAEKQLTHIMMIGDVATGGECAAGICLLATASRLEEEGKVTLSSDLMTTTAIVACENGFHRTLSAIIKYKGTNSRVGFHYPLRVACEKGYPEVVATLLRDDRVDPNASGGRSTSRPIVIACEKGHLDIVRQLLADPRTRPDVNESEALRLASKFGHSEIVEALLLDGRCDPESCNSYSLIWACNNGHPEVVRLLLDDHRVDPRVVDNRAIIHASCNGHLDVVKHLLNDERVSPEAQNNSSIVFASYRGHTEIVKLLLSSERVDPSAQGNMPLIMACVNGHEDVVEALLSDDRVDAACDIQRAGMLNQELVRILENCKVNVGKRISNIPLLAACEGGYTRIVSLLLEKSSVNPAGDYLAIKLASKAGHLDTVQVLLSDPRVNPQKAGRLAIKKAQSRGHEAIVSTLLLDPSVHPSVASVGLLLAMKRALQH
jgi:ankyrin repeat protein